MQRSLALAVLAVSLFGCVASRDTRVLHRVLPCIVEIDTVLVPPASPTSARVDRKKVPPRMMGIGSGIVLSNKGYILTNAHVVSDKMFCAVILPDGRRTLGRVVGRNYSKDVAVVKVDIKGLVPARLGDSDKVRVGDRVLAVGSPLGLYQTATAGMVSHVARGLDGFDTPLIQTDAPINPGNSGGALFDARGRVVGITCASISFNGGSIGLGFAVPINVAKKLIEDWRIEL